MQKTTPVPSVGRPKAQDTDEQEESQRKGPSARNRL